MFSMKASDIACACKGELIADESSMNQMVTGLAWDSRIVKPGMLFVAMPGEHVDGNDFVCQAASAGARLIIMTRRLSAHERSAVATLSCPVIVVDDAQQALIDIAATWRRRLHAVVIALTGSTGKTSSKDFLRAVLSQRFRTTATSGNQNNEIGIPATILSASENTEVLIVEMGMRGIGQIERLASIVEPTIGCITNIGLSHIELLGSQENIALAKAELFTALPQTGLAVVNADDRFTAFVEQAAHLKKRKITTRSFGFATTADVRAENVDLDGEACACFTLRLSHGDTADVRLAIPGLHNVKNALLAATVADYLGMKATRIATGLAKAQGSGMRMDLVHCDSGLTVINDTYNANPDSMRAALFALAHMDCAGRRIAVLGDMGELGKSAIQMHLDVGGAVAAAKLDVLVCVGRLSAHIAQGAKKSGMPEQAIITCDSAMEAYRILSGMLESGDLVLVKASRFMELDKLVEEIVE